MATNADTRKMTDFYQIAKFNIRTIATQKFYTAIKRSEMCEMCLSLGTASAESRLLAEVLASGR